MHRVGLTVPVGCVSSWPIADEQGRSSLPARGAPEVASGAHDAALDSELDAALRDFHLSLSIVSLSSVLCHPYSVLYLYGRPCVYLVYRGRAGTLVPT